MRTTTPRVCRSNPARRLRSSERCLLACPPPAAFIAKQVLLSNSYKGMSMVVAVMISLFLSHSPRTVFRLSEDPLG